MKNNIQLLFGILPRGLVVGKPATIIHTGGRTVTSPVQAITHLTKASVQFQTENTEYCVAHYQHPAAVRASAMPMVS